MLVVAIIGILMAVVAYNLVGQAGRAKMRATKVSMQMLKDALAQYNVEQNGYPPVLQTLVEVKILTPDKKLKDGWDHEFFYSPSPGATLPYQLISMGEDGLAGTADDLDAATIEK